MYVYMYVYNMSCICGMHTVHVALHVQHTYIHVWYMLQYCYDMHTKVVMSIHVVESYTINSCMCFQCTQVVHIYA